jgi:hypothetical protein
MITFAQFKKHWSRLRTSDEQDIFEVLGANLSQSTKNAILSDLNDAVEAAKDIWQQEIDDSIRKQATKLDVDDPLRIAIEGVL